MGKESKSISDKIYIDKYSIVDKSAKVGKGTKIWAFVQVRENVHIGENCNIATGAYIDKNVVVGNNVKVQNRAHLCDGLIVEDDCFIGPNVVFTNDKYPRNNLTRNLSGVKWYLKKGASVGTNCSILPDVTIGEKAVIGAGSVVTKDVPAGAVVCGNPAKIIKTVE
jgi:UDP-2-acetamido-3-amino-2,3-dideoxy-glucuronate N-acetyltransferase